MTVINICAYCFILTVKKYLSVKFSCLMGTHENLLAMKISQFYNICNIHILSYLVLRVSSYTAASTIFVTSLVLNIYICRDTNVIDVKATSTCSEYIMFM